MTTLNPGNAAAQMIIQAQSICTDLIVQITELNTALSRQQNLIDTLTPVAEWAPAPEPEEPEEDPEE